MSRWFAFAALLVASVASGAEPQQITLWRLDAGYYLIQNDKPVLFSPNGPIIPPDDPIPDTKAAALQKAAEAATLDPLRAATAANLAAVASLIQQQITAGSLKDYASIAAGYDFLSVRMIDAKTGSAAWAPFQKLVGQHLAALAQEGAQPAAYAAYFGVVADSLDASVPKAERVQSIDPAFLMMLFEMFLKLLPYILS